MNIYLLELMRFLKEKIKYIVTGTLVFGALFSIFLVMIDQTDSEEEMEIKESIAIFENDSKASFFQFYVEKEDGSSFRNGPIMNELFNMDDLHEEVLRETNININEIIDISKEKEYFEFSPIRVKFDEKSDIYTASFETGDESGNIEIANFYYDYLLDNNFTVLESHKIIPLVEPRFIEYEEQIEDTKLSQVKLLSVKNIITNTVFGFVLAFAMVAGLFILKELFGKKISFVFGYTAEDFDDIVIYDKKFANERSVQYFLSFPENAKKLVLSETELNKTSQDILFSDSNVNIQIINSIEFAPTTDTYDEIILIIKTGETTRNWYNKQIALIDLHDTKNKVIQLNNVDAE